MKTVNINFTNSAGLKLAAKIDFPLVGDPKAFVLFAHCFTCSKNLKTVENISRALTQSDMAVFRFDFTGLGQSEGEFSKTNFSSNLDDLKKAYEYLENEHEAPKILVGHSLGGAAMLHVAGSMEKVEAIVTIGAPSTPAHVRKLFKGSQDEIEKTGKAEVDIGGRNFTIEKQLIEDLEKNDSKKIIHALKKPLLIMHSPQDSIVGIENAAEIYNAAMHPKSFVSLDGSDHLMTNTADSMYAGSIIAPWASRYLEVEKEPVAPEGEVWTRISDKGFVTEITAGKHHMIADEPEEQGGNDLGPSPYGYLLSALGTCTAMTLRMYADHKKIDLKEVKVKLTHEKVHATDGVSVDGVKSKIDQIKRFIKLEGDLTDQQRNRLIEIADKCPVHKTIEGKPEIITEEISSF
tara:strand:+ start:22449 stop:23663 length:1215 start_codon:yes stop_codon:yes gene_type:complete